MIGIKKPSKKDRLAVKSKREVALVRYRKEQCALAWKRDKGMCRICNKVPAVECHHIWGRGKITGDWREVYTSLICTCRACHPRPIHHRPPKKDMIWIETLQKQINQNTKEKQSDERNSVDTR